MVYHREGGVAVSRQAAPDTVLGTPPRRRGYSDSRRPVRNRLWDTTAQAGLQRFTPTSPRSTLGHHRAGGATAIHADQSEIDFGTPPRRRGYSDSRRPVRDRLWDTTAQAGLQRFTPTSPRSTLGHHRAGGATAIHADQSEIDFGTPPRRRGWVYTVYRCPP